MFELRQLRTFYAVATEQSVTRAAANLGYAQSSVTAQIQALEQDLGVPLFNRVGRRIELTQLGHVMLGYAERILAVAEEARTTITSDQEPRGTLVVSAPETLLTYRLPEVIRKFQKRYPNVELSLTVHDNCAITAGQLTVNSTTDIAFILDQRSRRNNLIIDYLLAESIVVVVSANHRLANIKNFEVGELENVQVLLTERGGSYRRLFEQAIVASGSRLRKTLELPSIETIKQYALAGMGVAVLPEIAVAGELAQGKLVFLPWPKRRIKVYTQMIRHSGKWQSSAHAAFWNLAKHEMKSTLNNNL